MGKWAQYAKRGTARQMGVLAAPASADWQVTSITATTATLQRLATQPPGATGIIGRWKLASGSTWVSGGYALTNVAVTGLVTATNYVAQIAWATATVQLSDWSDPKAFTSA